jgi:phage shock protein A
MRFSVMARGTSSLVQETLADLRKRLPELWIRASAAVAAGREDLARLALRRRLVVLREVDSLSELIASNASRRRLRQRIEAADRLLEASLQEASLSRPSPAKPPVALDFEPAVEADLRALRADSRGRRSR